MEHKYVADWKKLSRNSIWLIFVYLWNSGSSVLESYFEVYNLRTKTISTFLHTEKNIRNKRKHKIIS